MKEVEGFSGYWVNEHGEVFSSRQGTNATHTPNKSILRKLSPGFNKGYPFVILRNNGRSFSQAVHRLVAKAFIPNPLNLPFVCHKDDNPKNPHKDNLFWGSPMDNVADMMNKGRRYKGATVRGEKVGTSKLTNEQVIELRAQPKKKGLFVEYAKKFGVGPQTIRNIYLRRGWKHLP